MLMMMFRVVMTIYIYIYSFELVKIMCVKNVYPRSFVSLMLKELRSYLTRKFYLVRKITTASLNI